MPKGCSKEGGSIFCEKSATCATCEHIPTELIRAEGVLERRRKHLLRKIGDLRDVMDQTATNHNA